MSGQLSFDDFANAVEDAKAESRVTERWPQLAVTPDKGHTPKPTQAARILEMLRLAGDVGVTPQDALRWAECFRLAARIPEIRWLIEADEEIVNVGSILPNGKKVARYVLRKRS